MASKRAMYKPTIVTKERKTLAQGRLVTKPPANTREVRTSTTKTLAQGQPQDDNPEISCTMSLGQTARQNLSSLLRSEVSFQAENSINPRRTTPHVSQLESPCKKTPSISLDLSDTDSDVFFKNRGSSAGHPAEVLVVDALRDTRGADDFEIDVQMGFVASPAKVICHTASKVHGSIRDSGDVGLAQRVTVDQLPTINLNEEPMTQGVRQRGVGGSADDSPVFGNTPKGQRSPPGSNQSAGAHPIQSTSKPEVVKMLFTKQHSDIERQMALGHTLTGALSVSETSLDSTSDASEISEKSTANAGGRLAPPKTKSAALSTSDIKKKKKATRVVQSRFMQQPTAKKGPMKATDRSIITKSSVTMATSKQSLMTSRKGSTPSKKKKGAGGSTSGPSFSTTPEVKGQGGKVSTPTADGSMFVAPGGVDVSAIGLPPVVGSQHFHSLDTTPDHSESRPVARAQHSDNNRSRQKSITASRGMRDTDSLLRPADTSETAHKKKHLMTQKRLDLLYFRYIQWVFLESKAKKAFKDQEKQAMTQLYGLWEANEKQRRHNNELDLQIAKLKHLRMLDDTLDSQEHGLASTASCIPQLEKQYTKMAEALDTTRHQIPVKGISVPADQEEYCRSLLHSLEETEQLLGEINVKTRAQSQTLTTFASSIHELGESLGSEVEEMAKCKELLAAAQTLTTQENSLQIQNIQDRFGE